MASTTSENGTMTVEVKLADDFAAWYSGTPWVWNPKKVEKANSILKMVLKERGPPSRPKKMKSGSTSSYSASNPESHPPVPEDEPPIYIVTPYFQVKKSPKGGYGAFALQDIPQDTEILVETALLKASDCDILDRFHDLTRADKEEYLKLASFGKLCSNKVIAIFWTNRFKLSHGNCGIFLIASRFNHSCAPSCFYLRRPNTEELVVVTRHDISRGQEITISYGPTGKALLEWYGFVCDCCMCSPIW